MDRDRWNDVWNELRRLTGEGTGFFIVKKQDRIGFDAVHRPLYGDVWILYRGTPGQPGAARLCKRRDLGAFLREVRKFARVTA